MSRRRSIKRQQKIREITNILPNDMLVNLNQQIDRRQDNTADPANDRRVWHPQDNLRRMLQDNLRYVTHRREPISKRPYADPTIDRSAFDRPERVRVCQGRKLRKRVLFATHKAGRGKRIKGRRKWTQNSKTKC